MSLKPLNSQSLYEKWSSVARCRASASLAGTKTAGFTLIEVMIAMIILVFISLGIYQATTETYHLREVLSAEGEFYNSIRMAMDIMQRDVAAMYSPHMLKPKPAPSSTPDPQAATPQELQDLANSDQGRTNDFWLGATERTGVRPSRFVGTDSKISFISVSHVRLYRDSLESDFAKVTYELIKDEEAPAGSSAMALLKTESTNAFDDDERRDRKFQNKYILLHGIKKLSYRYYRKDKDRLETSWDTDKEDFKEKYPDYIEVTFEVGGPSNLSFDGIYKLRPEVPLRGLEPSS